MSDESINELADYIVNEIEKEDFIYALKHYGCFKIKTKAKDIKKWWCENEDCFD